MVTTGGGQPSTTTTIIGGSSQILSAGVRKTIQTIKEIVGDHSDADIYFALKDSGMDPDETAQKLLNQDPFHEVKRRRDKKKESMGYKSLTEPRIKFENSGKTFRFRTYADSNARRGGYNRKALPGAGINREFRVVRDNRVNPESKQEIKSPALEFSIFTNERVRNDKEKGNPAGIRSGQKLSGGRNLSEASDGSANLQPRYPCDPNFTGTDRKELSGAKLTSSTVSWPQAVKPNNTQAHSAMLASSNSVGGYFSSKDPVHVPSSDSRVSSAVGAIKREVGVVGGGRQSTDNAVKDSSAPISSFSNSILGRDNSDSFRPFPAISKPDQLNQTGATESGVARIPSNRALFTNRYAGRSYSVGHQKASQHHKKWKPKSDQRSNVIGPEVIGTPTKSSSPYGDDFKDLESDGAKLQDELSRVNIHENLNVIIAQHIRVPETERCQLTFGSFGVDFDSSRNFGSEFQAVGASEESNGESAESLTGAAPKTSGNDISGSELVDVLDDHVRNSGSNSPASGEPYEHQLPNDFKDSSSPQDLDKYADIGFVQDNDPSYALSESQQQQDSSELASFQAYDLPTGYDVSYFRPTMDESVRGQGLPSPQDVNTSFLGAHSANSIPASSIAMAQQQMAQMYPQVHVSHFTNLLPYRQIISPVYVPQMAMPGYSSNPAYPHPSNGSSYLLMPGGSSHLGTNGLKYGIQPFKPVPAASPTGFGNFTSPTGYAINASGVVGSTTGLEDSSWMKYKDGNLYLPNQQAETSELWIHNPRELPGLQSAPYYNMPSQTPHAAAYMPSHSGHASFNAAVPQSSHMQFPGMYHPTAQPPAMANPHHMGPAMVGNVGVGVPSAAPGAQVGAYQQPQLGNFSWSPNF